MPILVTILLSLSFLTGTPQTTASTSHNGEAYSSVEQLNFLVGKWTGEGTAQTGQLGAGSCSFELSLQDEVMVRTNHSEYPATKDHAAIVHDDLMVIYPDHVKQQLRAFYTDNEGHVIHYAVTANDTGTKAVFLGDAENGQPRFRLTYTVIQPGHMTVIFEMAPPDKPDQFQRFIEGKLRRASD